jgi:hypothetical protein
VAIPLPAADHVRPLLEGVQEAGDLCRVVLQVGVEGHHGVAPGLAEAGRERLALAEVPPQAHHRHLRLLGGEIGQHLGAPVVRAVVDEDDLRLAPERPDGPEQLVRQRPKRLALVVDRHHDGH